MSFFTTCFDCSKLVKGRRETYPFWAMIYTLRGGVTFRIGEDTVHAGAGELIFYPAGLPHSIIDTDEKSWEVSFVTFGCDSQMMKALAGRLFVPDDELSERLRLLFKFGGKYFYNLPPDGDNTVGMHCRADSLELMRIKNELEGILLRLYFSLHNKGYEKKNEIFASASRYMKEHLGEPISLDELAGELGVSVSSLKKAFRDESGGGVNRYYIDLKLSKAAKMLCETDMAVSEISDKLGFSSQFYFSEQFKSKHGLSPLAYRKQQARVCRDFL